MLDPIRHATRAETESCIALVSGLLSSVESRDGRCPPRTYRRGQTDALREVLHLLRLRLPVEPERNGVVYAEPN